MNSPVVRETARREAILVAAEKLFVDLGFEGTSMRAIAKAAGVAQALLHYHFGTKERLFTEMFVRRSDAINAVRIERLDALSARAKTTIEEILDALLRPLLELGRSDARGGGFFSRLLVSLAAAKDELSTSLIERSYNDNARLFIAAFRRVLPGLDEVHATRGYLFVIGVGMSAMAPTGRLNRLTNGRDDDALTDATLAYLVPFLAAGLRQLAAKSSAQAKKGSSPVTMPKTKTARAATKIARRSAAPRAR